MMTTLLIILAITILTFVLLAVWFAVLLVERCLMLIDQLREIAKTTALDSVQVWSSGHMAAIDLDRERGKIEVGREYAQMRLIAQRKQLQASVESEAVS